MSDCFIKIFLTLSTLISFSSFALSVNRETSMLDTSSPYVGQSVYYKSEKAKNFSTVAPKYALGTFLGFNKKREAVVRKRSNEIETFKKIDVFYKGQGECLEDGTHCIGDKVIGTLMTYNSISTASWETNSGTIVGFSLQEETSRNFFEIFNNKKQKILLKRERLKIVRGTPNLDPNHPKYVTPKKYRETLLWSSGQTHGVFTPHGCIKNEHELELCVGDKIADKKSGYIYGYVSGVNNSKRSKYWRYSVVRDKSSPFNIDSSNADDKYHSRLDIDKDVYILNTL